MKIYKILILFFSVSVLHSEVLTDTIYFNNGNILKGKIVNQNVFDVYLKKDDGEILKINKDFLHRLEFGDSQGTEMNSDLSESTITDSETKEDPESAITEETIQTEKTEEFVSYPTPELKITVYYEIKKEEDKIYSIIVNGNHLNSVSTVLISTSGRDFIQKVYNLDDNSFQLKIDPQNLPEGKYDLILASKDGKKVTNEHFLDVLPAK